MSWFEKLVPASIRIEGVGRSGSVPEGVWSKCERCSSVLYRAELERSLEVCPKCDHHMRIAARKRLEALLDAEEQEEIGASLEPVDVLKFKDQKRYRDRLSAAVKATGESEAMVVLSGAIDSVPAVVAAFDFQFMAGSMGSVVGERFCRAVDKALERQCGLVCFSTSGGARMQESLISLMQMAKTSAALGQLAAAGLPYISVLTHPTTGGVSASLAMLGDVILAEPKAQIGFAGRRVIEQTVRETLPEDFQTAEFLLQHGSIDQIVDRRDMKARLAALLSLLGTHTAGRAA